MIEIAPCPVCRELDDCEHRLVEWYGWPGERTRGSLCEFLTRMESHITRVVAECARAGVVPRHPGLRSALESARDALEVPGLDEEDVLHEASGPVCVFVADCLRAAPGVVAVVNESPVVAHPEPYDYVSLFAADPVTVRLYLLDLLAQVQVQGDQLSCERAERSAGRAV